ncbi:MULTISPECIES: YdeI/OmpD-associated family protein [unclassified Variovorax]|uniref:YdeI/OmpD-associated family protein n=1 Tax=unclassified Variovorax TaxID=663243 RepID=UPI000D12860A|nr:MULTISPECIES: YdeI/OmpD-associated family protein [unclassified Variovorax]AVQ84764.1 bacteriocin-protection protein [Variovorax sp. PMC12]QRY32128.1 YdeI/OmpD-associated family protein [Variovorax sp. PDNC026]
MSKAAKDAERVAHDTPVECANAASWTRWLERHHASAAGVWLRIAKKDSGIASIDHPAALEEALCWGWIDGQRKSDDAQYFLQRFTPRTRRSIWSQINRAKVLKLIDEGRMQPAGLAEIERAKADGRWDAAYEGVAAATVPPDLQAALDANKKAAKFFATLDSRNRFAVLFRTQGAKKPETRARRIAQFVEMLAKGEKIHP